MFFFCMFMHTCVYFHGPQNNQRFQQWFSLQADCDTDTNTVKVLEENSDNPPGQEQNSIGTFSSLNMFLFLEFGGGVFTFKHKLYSVFWLRVVKGRQP